MLAGAPSRCNAPATRSQSKQHIDCSISGLEAHPAGQPMVRCGVMWLQHILAQATG